MSEENQAVMLKADRWSKIAAIFTALGTYIGGSLLVGDVAVALLLAALVGIGTRLAVPYYASRATTEGEGSAMSEYPMAGDYNHGAVGGALVIGPVFTILLSQLESQLSVLLSVGAMATLLTFAVLQFALPK